MNGLKRRGFLFGAMGAAAVIPMGGALPKVARPAVAAAPLARELIVEGAITASKIQAGSITARHLAIGSIGAARIRDLSVQSIGRG